MCNWTQQAVDNTKRCSRVAPSSQIWLKKCYLRFPVTEIFPVELAAQTWRSLEKERKTGRGGGLFVHCSTLRANLKNKPTKHQRSSNARTLYSPPGADHHICDWRLVRVSFERACNAFASPCQHPACLMLRGTSGGGCTRQRYPGCP